MKKYLSLIALAGVILFPDNIFAARATSETPFTVGESVQVVIAEGDEKKFYVIADSPAGEQYVTLIYDGVIGQSVYDQTVPDPDPEIDHQASSSYVGSVAQEKVETWASGKNFEQARLLEETDLTNLGITKQGDIYTIPSQYEMLKPIKTPMDPGPLEGSSYNYWTQIADGNDYVYAVILNEERSSDSDSWATLQKFGISSITDNPVYQIRPVVVVDKEYITCFDEPEPSTTTTVKQVQTGLTDYDMTLAIGLVAVGSIIYIIKKKEAFKRI